MSECPRCQDTNARAVRILMASKVRSREYTEGLWYLIERMRAALLAVPADPATGNWREQHAELIKELTDPQMLPPGGQADG